MIREEFDNADERFRPGDHNAIIGAILRSQLRRKDLSVNVANQFPLTSITATFGESPVTRHQAEFPIFGKVERVWYVLEELTHATWA